MSANNISRRRQRNTFRVNLLDLLLFVLRASFVLLLAGTVVRVGLCELTTNDMFLASSLSRQPFSPGIEYYQ